MRQKYKYMAILAALLLGGCFTYLVAQEDDIEFNIDLARFQVPNGQVKVEVYVSLLRSQLKIVSGAASVEKIGFNAEVALSKGDSLAYKQTWGSITRIRPEDRAKENQRLLTQTNLTVVPGKYKVTVIVMDAHSDSKGEKSTILSLSAFPDSTVSMSDIELASLVVQDTVASKFTKKGHRVIPNPALIYSNTSPMLYFYAELYGLRQLPGSNYSVAYRLLSPEGRVQRAYKPKKRHIESDLMVEAGGLNLVIFPTDAYDFQLEVRDERGIIVASGKKRFYMYRPAQSGQQLTLASRTTDLYRKALFSEYEQKSEVEIDEEFNSANFLSNKNEKAIFKSLDKVGKQQFMVDFWAKRPGVKEIHRQRLEYVNANFSGIKKGWQTDRGRVVLTYGQPDKVEKNFSLNNKRPYEIWRYYNQEGGLLFVFVEKGGFDERELVHSNAPREINDPDWKRWVNTDRF